MTARPTRSRTAATGIPVAVVAGFLGAGKTTLLNHLLRNRQGRRIGALVNDFGRIGIDALTVAGQVDAMVRLGNGCLCCAVDVAGLDALLAKLTRPAQRLDAVVIEASGLAEPREMVRQVLSSTDPRVRYGGLIQVVDVEHLEALRERHPHVDGHLAIADLVVLNKSDRVDDGTRARLAALVRGLAPGRPVLTTAHGRIDPSLLFDRTDGRTDGREDARPAVEQLSLAELLDPADEPAADQHLHAGYQAVDVELDRPLDPAAFLSFLDARPSGLYRIKGLVTFSAPGRHRTFAVQTVGDHVTFARPPADADPVGGARLVLIGSGIDTAAVRAGVRSCVATRRPAATDGALGRILVLAGVARR